VSVELVVGIWAICLWMSWLVWVETSPLMRVFSRTWRATSAPAGSDWVVASEGRSSEIETVRGVVEIDVPEAGLP